MPIWPLRWRGCDCAWPAWCGQQGTRTETNRRRQPRPIMVQQFDKTRPKRISGTVVGVAGEDRGGAVELLGENDACEAVRQRHRPE